MENQIVIDASECVTGRLASYAAKQALLGKSIVIVNCDSAIITGSRSTILEKYSRLRKMGGSGLKGPKIINIPERMMKRIVRGMLSHKQGRGSDALKRIMCYNSVPAEFKNSEKVSLKREIATNSLTLKQLCREI